MADLDRIRAALEEGRDHAGQSQAAPATVRRSGAHSISFFNANGDSRPAPIRSVS